MGYALDVENLLVMNVELYTAVVERLDLLVVLPPTLDVVDLTGARVLVADDVADTGKTLELVRGLLRRARDRGADGRRLRDAALGRALRLRVAPDPCPVRAGTRDRRPSRRDPPRACAWRGAGTALLQGPAASLRVARAGGSF